MENSWVSMNSLKKLQKGLLFVFLRMSRHYCWDSGAKSNPNSMCVQTLNSSLCHPAAPSNTLMHRGKALEAASETEGYFSTLDQIRESRFKQYIWSDDVTDTRKPSRRAGVMGWVLCLRVTESVVSL